MVEPAPVRWLLVGTGDIVRKRLGAALSAAAGSRLVGVCGRRLEEAQAISQLFAADAYFDDLQRALSDTATDAVYVATPVQSHVEIARAALLAGKHVLVEKPLGVMAEECKPLVQLAAGCQLTAGCAYYRRCLPRFAHALEVIKSGRIGDPLLVRMSYISWYSPAAEAWRVAAGGGGPVDDMGCHMLDLISALVGRPWRIFATLSKHIHSYVANDSCVVLADCGNGVALNANFHWSSRAWQHDLEITGTEGRLSWNPLDSGPVTIVRGRDVEQVAVPSVENVHQPLIDDFVAAIRGSRQPAVPLQEALETTSALDAIRTSLQSGTPVLL